MATGSFYAGSDAQYADQAQASANASAASATAAAASATAAAASDTDAQAQATAAAASAATASAAATSVASGTAISSLFGATNAWTGSNTFSGAVIIASIPVADPAVAGQLWSNAGVLSISAGPATS